jgi:beta-1,4-mannosyl-glycoprotein beta-1,4-N-acetylglucosaminyltransferase
MQLRGSESMIFDCFLFFKEFDVLDLRLNILNEAVDFFVLAEANITFSGQRKPFYFEQQKDQFKAFLPKIIHVKIEDDPPVVTSAWDREFWQRDATARGLKDAQPTDYVMYSDVDEIPNRKAFVMLSPMILMI